jgi:hypothetical protein
MIHFCRRNYIENKYRINSILKKYSNSHILIWILAKWFKYLGNGDNEYRFSISSIYKRNQLNRTYRIWTRLNILNFTSLNLNDFKIVQISLAVILVDRGHQYDSFAKGINWNGFLEFELYQKYSNPHIQIWILSNS